MIFFTFGFFTVNDLQVWFSLAQTFDKNRNNCVMFYFIIVKLLTLFVNYIIILYCCKLHFYIVFYTEERSYTLYLVYLKNMEQEDDMKLKKVFYDVSKQLIKTH